MARVDFLFELKRFGVSPIQTTADELHEDIANAKKAAGRCYHQSAHSLVVPAAPRQERN
jgi:hypothetical protein